MEPRKSREEKRLEREYLLHRDRMERTKSSIDNKTPYSCQFTRPIGHPRDVVRKKDIEFENGKLVERMVRTMENGGGIDNKEPFHDRNRLVYAQRARDFEQQRIARENAKILNRLERVQPSYRVTKFEADRERNEILAARISRYPYQPMDRTGSCGGSRTDY